MSTETAFIIERTEADLVEVVEEYIETNRDERSTCDYAADLLTATANTFDDDGNTIRDPVKPNLLRDDSYGSPPNMYYPIKSHVCLPRTDEGSKMPTLPDGRRILAITLASEPEEINWTFKSGLNETVKVNMMIGPSYEVTGSNSSKGTKGDCQEFSWIGSVTRSADERYNPFTVTLHFPPGAELDGAELKDFSVDVQAEKYNASTLAPSAPKDSEGFCLHTKHISREKTPENGTYKAAVYWYPRKLLSFQDTD